MVLLWHHYQPKLINALLWLLSVPWVLIGLLAGALVTFTLWVVACAVAGYAMGRGK